MYVNVMSIYIAPLSKMSAPRNLTPMQALATALRENRSVQILNLASNALGDEGAQACQRTRH